MNSIGSVGIDNSETDFTQHFCFFQIVAVVLQTIVFTENMIIPVIPFPIGFILSTPARRSTFGTRYSESTMEIYKRGVDMQSCFVINTRVFWKRYILSYCDDSSIQFQQSPVFNDLI